MDRKIRWSLTQYDLYEEIDGKTVDEVIAFLKSEKDLALEEGHSEVVCEIYIGDDSFGGLHTEIRFYGDVAKRDANHKLIPVKPKDK